jgi:hypothetical protein
VIPSSASEGYVHPVPLGTEPPRLHATHSTSAERHVRGEDGDGNDANDGDDVERGEEDSAGV